MDLEEPVLDTQLKSNSLKPLLSISCLTYSHEPYIRECLEGFLMQKTTFSFEVIIHDDASTDGTKEIIEEYTAKYPDIIFPIFQKENQYSKGIKPTWEFNFPRCRGKYIALCEGDDYWTDPYKLQKQVDFLEANKDYNLVGHHAVNSYQKKLGNFEKDTFTFDEIYCRNLRIPTASLVFRNNLEIPDWIFKVYGGDRALIYLNSIKGKIKILPFLGSFYRIHSGGIEQTYKKDKFNFAARNIKEDYLYYNLVKHLPMSTILFKKILKYHLYIIAQSILKFSPKHFYKATVSLFSFILIRKVNYE